MPPIEDLGDQIQRDVESQALGSLEESLRNEFPFFESLRVEGSQIRWEGNRVPLHWVVPQSVLEPSYRRSAGLPRSFHEKLWGQAHRNRRPDTPVVTFQRRTSQARPLRLIMVDPQPYIDNFMSRTS